MGLFDNDSGDDDGKSFRERVDDIREQRENANSDSANSGKPNNQDLAQPIVEKINDFLDVDSEEHWKTGDHDLGVPTPEEDIQQYEYKTLDLADIRDVENMGIDFSSHSGYPLPPDVILNKLGKEGWELVETVERPATDPGSFTDHAGTHTHGFIFRRPVTYQDAPRSDDESEDPE